MRWLLLGLVIGCGSAPHPPGGGDGTSDGGNDSDGGGDGGGGDGDGGGDHGGDAGTVSSNCHALIAPTVTETVSGVGGVLLRGGNTMISIGGLAPTDYWLRWTGAGWNSEAIPWPANVPVGNSPRAIDRIFPQSNGHSLIIDENRTWVMSFDGTALVHALQVPNIGTYYWGVTEDATGAYHILDGEQEWVSKPDGTWYPPAPVPLHNNEGYAGFSTVATMTDGREAILFIRDVGNVHHAWLTSHPVNGVWTTPVDITPQWAEPAQNPRLLAPTGGGLAIYVDGGLWRTLDGVAVGDYELTGTTVLAGECLDQLVIANWSETEVDSHILQAQLWKSEGTTWESLAGTLYDYYNGYTLATLPGGKVFWNVATPTGMAFMVSP